MQRVIDEDLERYSRYLTRHRNCIVCGGEGTAVWARYGSYTAVSCQHCGFVWINPFLSNKGLDDYYQDYIGMRFKDKVKTEQRAIQYNIDKTFLQLFASSGRVLDVGCSGGFFLSALGESFEKFGVDIDAEAVKYARENYPFGDNVRCQAVEDSEYPDGSFDVVIMRGVIEHLPDPEKAVEKVAALLRTGGIFFIAATPDVSSFCADLYREKWNQFHPVRHLTYFNLETLSRFLKRWRLDYIAHQHPYLETPYADLELDYMAVRQACVAKAAGHFDTIGRSRAFWGNMLNCILRKAG
jgi:2-polyprenyl-3-methyl-5-hydroxy-6-metoxy-1,4-benzoquinol methylase